MLITWEDRRNAGKIDENYITTKPNFGFEYAFVYMTDTVAQWVESHNEGFNEEMSQSQKDAVQAYYNAWEAPVIVPHVPTIEETRAGMVVTMRQARLALLDSGLLSTIDSAIASSTDEALKIEWEYAMDVKRTWTSLIALATSLGMTETQLDDLFTLASTK